MQCLVIGIVLILWNNQRPFQVFFICAMAPPGGWSTDSSVFTAWPAGGAVRVTTQSEEEFVQNTPNFNHVLSRCTFLIIIVAMERSGRTVSAIKALG